MTDVVPLRSVCDILNGYAFKSSDYSDAGFRVMRIGNVQKGKIVDSDPMFIPSTIAAALPNFQLRKDDILVSLTGNVGRVGQVPSVLLPAVLNQRVAVIRPKNPTISHGYLYQYLNSDVFESNAMKNANGVAQLNLSTKWIAEHQITLPPLEDQQRIAYLLSKVEGLITQRKQHLQQLDDLLKSVFLTMFGDPVRNEKGWDTATLDRFCERVVDCPHSTPTYSDKPTGNYCVRSSDIVNGFLDLQKTYQVDSEIFTERIRRYEPQIGDIVYSREGGRLGNAARIIDEEKVCLGQRMMLFNTNEETHSEFLWALLESVPFKAKLQGLVGGGAAPRVNIKDLMKLLVIMPPPALQGEFAASVQKMDRLRFMYKLGLIQLEFLFAVLSQDAFKGHLDLSRVALPQTNDDVITDFATSQQSKVTEAASKFELLTPANVTNLASTKGRKTVMEQWLNAYVPQLGKEAFSPDAFMKLVGQKLSDLQSADDAPDIDYELSAADYDHVKHWIFANLKSNRLKQDYDDANNRVQISLAKD